MFESGLLSPVTVGHDDQVSDAAVVDALVTVEVALARAYGAVGAAPADAVEDAARLGVTIGGRDYALDALVVRLPGEGKLPVALITHGSSPGDPRAATIDWLRGWAHDLAHRGWLAVAVMRRGYGGSDGEDLVLAARRELREETGLEADTWELVGSMFALNGICHAPEHVFLARGLEDRGELAARATPFGPPVDQGDAVLGNGVLEGVLSKFDCAHAVLQRSRASQIPSRGRAGRARALRFLRETHD